VTAIGLVVLTWSLLRVFRGIDIAFSRVYGVVEPKPLLRQLRDAGVVLAGIGIAVAATVTVSALPAIVGVSTPTVVGPIGLLVVLAVVFFPLYYVFPTSDVTVEEAVSGSVFAAGG
jgi:uncharacterized BrkB/YihY/UPF0761 family membrane protein